MPTETTGLLRFDQYMEEALYGESGFFTRGAELASGPADRGGDFATAPELGSLFGSCVADYLDRTWHELGRPDPFVVIEGGAGRGTLAGQVLASVGGCAEALRCVLVERVEPLRVEAAAALREDSRVSVIADLPAQPAVGVVLANELLDNLPFRLLERSTDGWDEVHIKVNEGSPAVEAVRPAPADAAAMADALVPGATVGARVPLQLKAAVWLRRALRLVHGRVLVFDYGTRTTAELLARPDSWLRTYRAHRRGHDPLAEPGSHDITCDVAFDQLPQPAALTRQADWLASQGLDELTAQAEAAWRRARSKPNAKALANKALLDEAAALTDPAGMGAFWAAEWSVN